MFEFLEEKQFCVFLGHLVCAGKIIFLFTARRTNNSNRFANFNHLEMKIYGHLFQNVHFHTKL